MLSGLILNGLWFIQDKHIQKQFWGDTYRLVVTLQPVRVMLLMRLSCNILSSKVKNPKMGTFVSMANFSGLVARHQSYRLQAVIVYFENQHCRDRFDVLSMGALTGMSGYVFIVVLLQ